MYAPLLDMAAAGGDDIGVYVVAPVVRRPAEPPGTSPVVQTGEGDDIPRNVVATR